MELTAKSIFDELLPAMLIDHGDSVKSINAVMRFVITGDEGGTWTADFTGTPAISRTSEGDADVTLTVSANDFAKLAVGGMDEAIDQILNRKVKVDGDQYLAIKMQDLFSIGQEAPESIPLSEMSAPRRFMEYALAFEESYRYGDWSHVQKHFTEDASYDCNPGPIWGLPRPGKSWNKTENWFKTITEAADKKFTRVGEIIDGPRVVPVTDVPFYDYYNDEIPDEVVRIGWVAHYDIEGAPRLTGYGLEWALYRDGKIFLLRDQFEEQCWKDTADWLENYGHLIDWDEESVKSKLDKNGRDSVVADTGDSSSIQTRQYQFTKEALTVVDR